MVLKRCMKIALLMGASSALHGCATYNVAAHYDRHAPYFFGGTRLNIAAMAGDEDRLERFGYYGMSAPEYPLLDLPFSLVADTGLLAVTVTGSALDSLPTRIPAGDRWP